jgi:hypothetical protein
MFMMSDQADPVDDTEHPDRAEHVRPVQPDDAQHQQRGATVGGRIDEGDDSSVTHRGSSSEQDDAEAARGGRGDRTRS